MRTPMLLVACAAMAGLAVGCDKPQKLTAEEAAIAQQTTQQMNASANAVASSRYRTYRWMTPEEMVASRLGYDPSMDPGTRYEVEQAIDDDLANKGFQSGAPADFVVAFSDAYLDRNRSAPMWAFEGPTIEATSGPAGSQVVGFDNGEMYRTPEETFTILFLDAQTRRLLWRGKGVEKLNGPKQSDEAIETAVYRALDDMPVPLAP